MVKVLIYSSKEIYDNSSYEGRAEADMIAYRINDYTYRVVKNRYWTSHFAHTISNDLKLYGEIADWRLSRHIEKIENDEWKRDVADIKLQEKYKDHPLVELSKNER